MIKQQLEIALHAKYLQAVDSLRSDLQLDEPVQEDASPTTSKIQVITESANIGVVSVVMTTCIVY